MHASLTKITVALTLGLAALGAQAQEVTLRAASSFAKDSYFDRKFESFVKDVNENGKGIVQINFVGGPEAIPAFEVGNALSSGVIDMANVTGVFISNLVPESLTLSFSPVPMKEVRASGGYELMDKIHREKGNMVWLGRVHDGLQYHIYTNEKPTDGASFAGMKLRSVPVYRTFFQSLGANPLQVPPGEVYTALERGMVDGYGWPSVGIFDLGWQEKTKYRIDPGFYNVEVSLFMNQDTWKKLTDEQRTFLEERIQALEARHHEDPEAAAKEKQQLIDAGIEIIELSEADAADFTAKANKAAWDAIKQASPQHAAELHKYFSGE